MSLDKTKVCQQLSVLERIQETEDTISLVLEIPRTTGGKFLYKAGQFVTLFLDINGEEIRRSYSLASSPEVETAFKITIKLVPGGKGSTYLISNIRAGDKLWVTPPAGHFCLPTNLSAPKIFFYAAGSGITPIISLIKSALRLSATTECVLLFQNRHDDNIIFLKELNQLNTSNSGRFHVEHILSQATPAWSGLKGRADSKIIRNLFTKYPAGRDSLHFICGPDGYMKNITESLVEAGINKANIVQESFSIVTTTTSTENTAGTAASSEDGDFTLDEEAVVIGERASLSKPALIEAVIDGETHTVPYKKDKTILECLLDANLNPPYSCLDGACMACIAKVQTGLVYQEDMGILTDDNVEAKDCLTCQARPASKLVKVNYEIF